MVSFLYLFLQQMFILKKSYPIEIEIDLTRQLVIELLTPHLTNDDYIPLNTKKFFRGTLAKNQLKLQRIKRFDFFDYSISTYSGEIISTGNQVKLSGTLKPLLIYRYNTILIALLFLFIGIVIVNAQRFDLIWTVGMLAIVSLITLITKSKTKHKLDDDKAKFVLTLELVFGTKNLRVLSRHRDTHQSLYSFV